jgi:hypothetical protein
MADETADSPQKQPPPPPKESSPPPSQERVDLGISEGRKGMSTLPASDGSKIVDQLNALPPADPPPPPPPPSSDDE